MSNKHEAYTLTHEQKSEFYGKMVKIAIPVIIQNIISIGLGVADTMMIGKLGEDQLAGVGAGNQLFWLFWGIIFGFYSGANAHSSQYWGAGNKEKTWHVLGMDYIVGFTIGVITILTTYTVGGKLLWFFSRDPQVIQYGIDYMRIACFANFFSFVSFAFIFNCRVVQKLKFVTTVNVGSLFVNIFLNWVFIYGNLGAPALGVKGAALATTLTRVAELLAVIIYALVCKDHPLRVGPKKLFTFKPMFFVNVLRTAFPVVVTETMFSLVGSATFAIYGTIGSAALAVIQVATNIANLAQVVFFGLGNAAAVTIGGALGVRDRERAIEYAKISFRLALILNVIVSAMIILIAKPISGFYDFEPDTITLMIKVIFVWAIISIPKMTNYTLVCGVLRAGGDTLYTLKVDIIGNVFIQLILCVLSVLVFKWALPVCILFVSISDCVRLALNMKRYLSLEWINMYN
ncbi:MAG: MATE family efflux transporter [Firmicutes bacterium]|nr:MATE family efflux transporter [Bacillota bacterium]MBQ9973034.1 MATE family efflux transporter [Bacillota bacterium]